MDVDGVYRNSMGRKLILLAFWLVGYALGFFAWLVRAPVISFIETFGLSSDMAGALITGFAGSLVMLVGVVTWSYLSSS
ncbi:MAG: hypothetical protein JRN56_07200 [Nitrososphaerota archaeon]|nr:hypothetical protein [Nitrososphaerota archaeon]MDG6984906.1 hypothetical protein [Nitrososphaerota archaeon]MDG6993140.1 hypothetical protein [Nitrososphaerota archaeon]MDG7003667.1 hypothetical protein [Nitrososphaerota archaeon]MDG7032208.1 hypothetical protein [Nitrososphaerota archaeon]